MIVTELYLGLGAGLGWDQLQARTVLAEGFLLFICCLERNAGSLTWSFAVNMEKLQNGAGVEWGQLLCPVITTEPTWSTLKQHYLLQDVGKAGIWRFAELTK